MALMVVRAIPAFQAEETAKAVKNKTKKAAKDAADATSKAVSTAEKNVKKTTRKAAKETADATSKAASTAEKNVKKTTRKAAKETADTTSKAASTAEKNVKKTTRKAPREQAPGAAVSSPETSKKATSSAIGTARRESKSIPEPVNKATSVPTRIVPDSEIGAAKAAGQVWVNTETGVYHKGGRWYGATKQGKFMSESDAVNAGYHAAKGNR
jgi:hypothetical protein